MLLLMVRIQDVDVDGGSRRPERRDGRVPHPRDLRADDGDAHADRGVRIGRADAAVGERQHAVAHARDDGVVEEHGERTAWPGVDAMLDARVVDDEADPRGVVRPGSVDGDAERHSRRKLSLTLIWMGFAELAWMQALVSCVKFPIDDFSMCTVPAFWMSMPISGSGGALGTPEMSSPRSVTMSASPALITMPGRDTSARAQHADTTVDARGTDDLERFVDRHRTIARGVENHDLTSR